MSIAFLGLGSNINARQNIVSAIQCLRETFDPVDFSPAYQTAAFGFAGNDFINLVARVETELSPQELKDFLGDLEDSHDRNREAPKFGNRTLDIDILLYDDLFVLSPALEVPRGEILEAAYVLKPLFDLAPELVHPVTRTTISELWKAFPQHDSAMEIIDLD